jgi:hypothetical protein
MPEPRARIVVFEVDFGDSELMLCLHPDGKYTLETPDKPLVLNKEEVRRIVEAFAGLKDFHEC